MKISTTGYNQDYRNNVKLILHYELNVTEFINIMMIIFR
jgi:hypothetical protein